MVEDDLRPRLDEKVCGDGVGSSKCSSHHSAVQHGDEEDLRIEEGPHCVEECHPALTPVLLAVEQCKILLLLMSSLRCACSKPLTYAQVRGEYSTPASSRGTPAVTMVSLDSHPTWTSYSPISEGVRGHRVSGMKKNTPMMKKPAPAAVM